MELENQGQPGLRGFVVLEGCVEARPHRGFISGYRKLTSVDEP
jgi:hypothetical protein